MKECEDCGDAVTRRSRCRCCGIMVCRWCYHHVHIISLAETEQNEVQERKAEQIRSEVEGNDVRLLT